ncbi:hypothetical protein L1987_37461 [Smallanthus sonchifolius]|uniref:Uncharacterized protein n=1 Tax=Smallanthus sonchifolius TaxID=185202 RepID=A0ACB9HGV1_9ASTR|nr:hypothetical protein L1987_37461 [Smallanthus sonchifolius]
MRNVPWRVTLGVSDLSSDLCSINGVLLTDSSLDLCYLNEGLKQIIAYSYHSRSYLHHQQSFVWLAGRNSYSHLDTSSLAYWIQAFESCVLLTVPGRSNWIQAFESYEITVRLHLISKLEELVQYLGTLVRMTDHVSIEYSDWRKVPMQKKEDMYLLVKEEDD